MTVTSNTMSVHSVVLVTDQLAIIIRLCAAIKCRLGMRCEN